MIKKLLGVLSFLLITTAAQAGIVGVTPEWVNIKAVCLTGNTYTIDNLGGDSVYIEESTVAPTTLSGRLLRIREHRSIVAGMSNIWVRSKSSAATISINEDHLPANPNGTVGVKDVIPEYSNIHNFSGSVLDLFNDLHSTITDTTTDNPKELLIHFDKTVVSNAVGLGAYTGDFSNVEIQIGNSGGVFTTVVDDSALDTKLSTATYRLPVTPGFNAIKILFHTEDTVTLSNFVVIKAVSVIARLQATKPDNIVTDIHATTGGNLKISVEEFESGISVNNNTQLKITPYESNGAEYKQDLATGSFTTVGYEHHEIHAGSHYFICDYSLDEANGATIEFVLTTDDSTKWMHSTLDYSASDGATLEVYKDPTGITGGTTLTPVNNNGNSANTSLATIIKDPTSITSVGVRAAGFIAGGGRTAGFNQREREIVLEQNTAYLFRITSLAVSNDIGWCFEWYEHTNR